MRGEPPARRALGLRGSTWPGPLPARVCGGAPWPAREQRRRGVAAALVSSWGLMAAQYHPAVCDVFVDVRA